MNELSNTRVTIVSPEDSIDSAIRKMAVKRSVDQIDGIAVAVDVDGLVRGVLTDGDIRRAYARGVDFQQPLDDVMVKDPITVRSDESPREILNHVTGQVSGKQRLRADIVRHVIAVDEHGRLDRVIDVAEFLLQRSSSLDNVAVYGLGYVGLTIAVTLANIGHRVFGVESNARVRNEISEGRTRLHESGLEDMLALVRENDALTTHEELDHHRCNVYVVAVGTPIGGEGEVDETALLHVAECIGRVLKRGDLVQLRSTVPVGCTRERFLPRLLKHSSLTPGRDFHLAFTPERTIEGDALAELRSLPQIVGGYSTQCLEKASSFWSTVTNAIVRVESLEAAELVKLANNTFRDLSFSFANELAEMCDGHNIDAFKLIEAANEGYPRNRIPRPSPGVGGYCLTKDPVIYQSSAASADFGETLGGHGRAVNRRAGEYPKSVLRRWVDRSGTALEDIRILCLGMAFKGFPETGDMRESVSMDLARWVNARAGSTVVWDAVVDAEDLAEQGLTASRDVRESLAEADVIFILNNNPAHSLLGIPVILNKQKKPRLVFDGWHQLDRNELERIPEVTYSTMGYMTPQPR